MERFVETLPVADPQGRSEERLDNVEPEERMTLLFRRWPSLAEHEAVELRRLWDARVERAKQR